MSHGSSGASNRKRTLPLLFGLEDFSELWNRAFAGTRVGDDFLVARQTASMSFLSGAASIFYPKEPKSIL